jgi:N6-L-threonylcarbamoyladenine synthase
MPEPELIHILAFESSCDDTSVALLRAHCEDETPQLVAWSVQSQNEVHEKFGGVVPELASRAHLQNLLPCLQKVLKEGGVPLSKIDAFAATSQPGLIGCLLVGHSAAKTLSMLFSKPFLSCHHIQGHVLSVFLEHQPALPFLAAIVSGGHTSLYRVDSLDDVQPLGQTRDDALGEAYDKGAKMLGLSFPGGPELELLAQSGEPSYPFGKVKMPGLDFSFSGMKSELARLVKREGESLRRADAAASYQTALLDHLISRIEEALRLESMRTLVVVGGVARNQELRRRLDCLVSETGIIDRWIAPSPAFCTDNAAMIGVHAFRLFKRGEISDLQADVGATSRPARKSLTRSSV